MTGATTIGDQSLRHRWCAATTTTADPSASSNHLDRRHLVGSLAAVEPARSCASWRCDRGVAPRVLTVGSKVSRSG